MRNFISNPITYLMRGSHHIVIPNMYRVRYILDYIKVGLNYHYCSIVICTIVPLYHCLLYCSLSYHYTIIPLYCCLSYHYTIVYFTVVYHTIVYFTTVPFFHLIIRVIVPLCYCFIGLLQILIFQYSFWLALFMLFVTAATRLSLFGLLYLLLCFIYLYRGQNLLTDPRRTRIKWWVSDMT